MLAAILISLSLVGIDVTVLGVFGGALGVGLGFGLQKIASNYVSGFIILIDRSLRIGDTINVSGLTGMVTQIRTRYTVVRGLDGIETLIPNEKLITDVVQNQSSYLTRGYAKAAVQIAYASDLEKAMTLLAEAAKDVPRVLQEPAPTPYLVSFGTDGINLELGFWIENAAQGTSGVRSAGDTVRAARSAHHRWGGRYPVAAGNCDRPESRRCREPRLRPKGGMAAGAPGRSIAAATIPFVDALQKNSYLLQTLGTVLVECRRTLMHAFTFLTCALTADVARLTGKLPC